MFFEALATLDADQVRQLAARGVPPARVSDWRAKRRLPTRPHAYALAHVAGLNFDALERELTMIEIQQEAENNSGLRSLLPTIKKAVATL
jgi:hypothetical protein